MLNWIFMCILKFAVQICNYPKLLNFGSSEKYLVRYILKNYICKQTFSMEVKIQEFRICLWYYTPLIWTWRSFYRHKTIATQSTEFFMKSKWITYVSYKPPIFGILLLEGLQKKHMQDLWYINAHPISTLFRE